MASCTKCKPQNDGQGIFCHRRKKSSFTACPILPKRLGARCHINGTFSRCCAGHSAPASNWNGDSRDRLQAGKPKTRVSFLEGAFMSQLQDSLVELIRRTSAEIPDDVHQSISRRWKGKERARWPPSAIKIIDQNIALAKTEVAAHLPGHRQHFVLCGLPGRL
jgi:hypothetical protein